MGKNGVFLSFDDAISAMELLNDHYDGEAGIEAFEIRNVISAANFGCISNSDNVLVISSVADEITFAVSYIFAPNNLKSFWINVNAGVHNDKNYVQQKWEKLNYILSGYAFTKPTFYDTDIDNLENENELFDLSIAGFLNSTGILADEPFNRFKLEAGMEYDIFAKLLEKVCRLIKKDGKLLILTRPGWVLKAWMLVHELGLQLEYDGYKLYVGEGHHPNSILWLRFVKRENEFDVEEHKRNIRSLMEDNNIDRLYAHRNNLIFPYTELSYDNSEAYITLNQNMEYMQYFFSKDTTMNMAELCEGYTACLVTPSVAQYAHCNNKNVVLFERDNRFRENGEVKYVKYDLEKGLTRFQINKYAGKFNRVICDPPFDIGLEVLANDILELIKNDEDSLAYIVFPESRKISLIRAMQSKGFSYKEDEKHISVEYAKPPKIVRVYGKQAIQLFVFIFNPQCI